MKKTVTSLIKNKVISHHTKIPKRDKPLLSGGITHATLGKYDTVVTDLHEQTIQEKVLVIEEAI